MWENKMDTLEERKLCGIKLDYDPKTDQLTLHVPRQLVDHNLINLDDLRTKINRAEFATNSWASGFIPDPGGDYWEITCSLEGTEGSILNSVQEQVTEILHGLLTSTAAA